MLKAGQTFSKFSMRLVLPLIGLLLSGHFETSVLLQNGGDPTPLQNPESSCAWTCLLSSFPSCCSGMLCSAEGELYYGVTCVYFCTPFNTLVGPPSFSLDEKSPLCVQLAVFMLYVQNPCLPHKQSFLCCPFRKGTERRKVR